MYFVIRCIDKPDHGEVRAANRPNHLAYLEANAERALAAGPMLDQAGTGVIGSLLIMEMADRSAAETFAAGDPYAKAGLFADVTITPWRRVYPKSDD